MSILTPLRGEVTSVGMAPRVVESAATIASGFRDDATSDSLSGLWCARRVDPVALPGLSSLAPRQVQRPTPAGARGVGAAGRGRNGAVLAVW